jgi:hypothetical protein
VALTLKSHICVDEMLYFSGLFPVFICLLQASCTSAPSKVQSGATLCNWSSSDLSCSLAPPPSDPIFTILVALLTIVMSIPIIMLLQFILDEYASKQPGSLKPESEVLAPHPSDAPTTSPHGTSSAPQSDFGKLIIGGAVAENTSRFPANSALLVYTGNICLPPSCLSFV